jgi:uncharacterized membrane protein
MADTITKSIMIKAEPSEVFRVLSDYSNFTNFIEEVESIETGPGNISHWKAKGPFGKTLEFNIETTRFDANQRIGWSTKDFGGDLTTSGQFVLAGLPNTETELTVTLNYEGKGLSGLLTHGVDKKIDHILQNIKGYLEGTSSQYRH